MLFSLSNLHMFPLRAAPMPSSPFPCERRYRLRVLRDDLTPFSYGPSDALLAVVTSYPLRGGGRASQVPGTSLTTCHALGPRQSLRNLTIYDSLVLASGTLKPSPTASLLLTGLNCFGEVRLPCGLQCSLCTLQVCHFSRYEILFHTRNTRYWWLVKPYQARTYTLQEAPSCAWRTNALLSRQNDLA